MNTIIETIRAAARSHQAGDLDQAERLYREVLEQQPNQPQALHSLGLIAYQRGDLEDAAEFVRQALDTAPNNPHAHHSMGVVLEALSRFEEAIHGYQQATMLKCDYTEAYQDLATLLQSQGRIDEAIRCHQKAVALAPSAQACLALAELLRKQGRLEETVPYYQAALEIKPDIADAHTNLAGVLQGLGRMDEAIEHCRLVVKQWPNRAQAHFNLASAFRDAGRIDEAIIHNAKALALAPEDADTHWNQAVCLLLAGRFQEGWKEFAWRRRVNYQSSYPHTHYQPHWDGSRFPGKRLFIHGEQGLGDAIQFVRYLPMVKALGGTVILGVWKPLYPLLKGIASADQVVELSWQQRPAVVFDLQASIMDLPGIFGTTVETIPGQIPYLRADPTKVGLWKENVTGPGRKIGIAWAGSPRHANDANRSCPLGKWEPLTHIPGVRMYSLQVDLPDPRSRDTLQSMGIQHLGDSLRDFTDTAAAIENLDLVISVDTAVLHLAAALGKRAWGLIPYSPDWRWMLGREDSPWYPTLRLLRQPRPGDWHAVILEVADSLTATDPIPSVNDILETH